MKDKLAERLLAEVMHWNGEDLARELPDLQVLASFKYDEYQQYSPGMKFLESLAIWLNQFDTAEERKLAYSFIRSQIIFISNAEMTHLVSISYLDWIQPFLIKRAAQKINIPEIYVKKIINSQEFRILLRQSLFIGLADGAHLDVFRRSNPQISHEQILLSYDFSEEKGNSIINSLKKDIEVIQNKKIDDADALFNDVILIDDFSASGLSYIRKKSDGSFGGKIAKILTGLYSDSGNYRGLINKKNLQVSVILYVATDKAKNHLETTIREWLLEKQIPGKPNIFIVHELPENVRLADDVDGELSQLLKKYFDDSIIDESYQVGSFCRPYLGFDECALPLVLSHNTPNNSLPILWLDLSKKYTGLFPRVSRHKEVTK